MNYTSLQETLITLTGKYLKKKEKQKTKDKTGINQRYFIIFQEVTGKLFVICSKPFEQAREQHFVLKKNEVI